MLVLKPLLWNISYDIILRRALLSDCHANDTLVVAARTTWERAVVMHANITVTCIIDFIKEDSREDGNREKTGRREIHPGLSSDWTMSASGWDLF